MKIVFLGVGEACDEYQPNNSHLVISETILLLDCGYTTPPQLWKYNPDPSFLDAIYITHRHADHYFGIPPLFVRLWEERRTKPLTIVCQKGLKGTIEELIEYGYRGLYERLTFPVEFLEIEEEREYRLNELTIKAAPTVHSVKNLAIRISDGRNTVCFSGDGRFNSRTEALYRGADLLIHEAYLIEGHHPNHACIMELADMAQRNGIGCLALTHLQRGIRRREIETIRAMIEKRGLNIIIPEALGEYTF
jgi:ribonuclease BN (tRNA processing enzyme)